MLRRNGFLKYFIEGQIEGWREVKRIRGRRSKQLMYWLLGKDRILGIERGSTRSHSVDRLYSCRKTDYEMNERMHEWMTWPHFLMINCREAKKTAIVLFKGCQYINHPQTKTAVNVRNFWFVWIGFFLYLIVTHITNYSTPKPRDLDARAHDSDVRDGFTGPNYSQA